MNNTLVKGMAVLEALAHSNRALGVSELAVQLEIGKSNAHRLLQALTELGYVQRNGDAGTYQASIRLWELGVAMFSNLDLPALATPAMERLLLRCQETVHLSMLDNDEVVYLHKIDSPQPVRAYSQTGGRAPAYCVATGKAMLSALSDARLNDLSLRLQPHSPKSIVAPEAFLREMARIRDQGFAENRGEYRETVCGVAAVIRDPSGKVMAAIGISGPSERVKPSRFKTLGREVMSAAAEVEQAIAGDGQASGQGRGQGGAAVGRSASSRSVADAGGSQMPCVS
ncbi:MAG: IclR family transcriptional regulator [Xanthobacter sp.]